MTGRSLATVVALAMLGALGACAGLDSADTQSDTGAVASYYLPKTVLEVTLESKEGKLSLKATPKNVADGKPYFIYYDNNVLSDDQLCVARSSGGLLQAVVLASTDRTIDILVNIAELAARFIRAPSVRALTRKVPDGTVISFWVDTAMSSGDRIDLETAVARQLTAAGLPGYRFDLTQVVSATAATRGDPRRSSRGRIYFRSTVKRPVILKNENGVPVALDFPDVVDRASTSHVNVSRAFGVEKVTEIHMREGTLIGVRIRKPSEALALSELPLKVIDRILTVPANFFARAFGPSADREKLIQDQSTLIDKFKALEEARAKQRTPSSTFVTVNNQNAPAADTAEQITCTPKPKG